MEPVAIVIPTRHSTEMATGWTQVEALELETLDLVDTEDLDLEVSDREDLHQELEESDLVELGIRNRRLWIG